MINLIIADDHPLIRAGLRSILTAEEDIAIIGEATNGEEVQAALQEGSPDILLLDLGMPGPSPVTTIQFVQKHHSSVKIIILTAYKDEAYVRDMIKLGVSGYILKDEVPETLVCAIRSVVGGGSWLSSSVVEIISKPSLDSNDLDGLLTKREQAILCLIAKGNSNGQIAQELEIAEGTVKNHVVSIYMKLNIHSRAEAVVRAMNYVNSTQTGS